MRRFFILFLILITTAISATSSAPGRSLAHFEDQGEFLLYLNEDLMGSNTFKWDNNGAIRSETSMSIAGQTARTVTEIRPDEGGEWKAIKMTSGPGEVEITREGEKLQKNAYGRKSTGKLKPGSYLYDYNTPALMSSIIRQYDKEKKGIQRFPAYVVPGDEKDIRIELVGSEKKTINGSTQVFSVYDIMMPMFDMVVWTDSSSRVIFQNIPTQHSYFIRKGYETLGLGKQDDEQLSKADCRFRVEQNVMLPMRDGVKLATDFYIPEGRAKVPVILIRTPYSKDMMEYKGKYWARRGYGAAIQDCRGRFKSQGVWEPFVNEAEDGYDTVEMVAGESWSNGKVGMIGGSYVGWVQWWAASQKPPHLVTIIPNVSPPDPHYNIPYEHGAFWIQASIWWAKVLETAATADVSGAAMMQIDEADYSHVLNTLPAIDIDKVLLGRENPYWRKWIERGSDRSYWAKADFQDKLKGLNIPVFHQSGWFDGDGIGTKLNYLAMKENPGVFQKLIVGPWGHTDTAMRTYEDRDFGKAALIDLQREYIRWFDFWLKGIKNGIDREPRVMLFVMGDNAWKKGNTYPLEETKDVKLYLESAGAANTSKGDGSLAWEAGRSRAEFDQYEYDPENPTPDPGFYPTKSDAEKKETLSEEEEKGRIKSYHRNITDARRDILVFRTGKLEQSLTFCGPVSCILYASTSAKDTDWFVNLLEENGNGELFPLVSGKVRAKYRNSPYEPELLEPGKIIRYELDLWHTGITIPRGNRLWVEVSSALFPSFSRNLNTGGNSELEREFVKASQRVYHSAECPTCIVLPVVK